MPGAADDESLIETPDRQDREEKALAPYAMRVRLSRGRCYPEEPHPYRTLYHRDRDRIVHSTAFRRLMYKTQVLVNQTSDHHRTRLTHTLEVAQISRTIARQLGLNEDLTEAIALAHDLGHPPFGHAGETALAECMADHGGFEHNRHGLRLITELEYRYPNFPGLNLSWEVLEAQARHSKNPQAQDVGPYLSAGGPLLEAQVVDAADSLAYDTNDIDDAWGVGFIPPYPRALGLLWLLAFARVGGRHGRVGPPYFQPAVVRALIDWQVSDLLEQTAIRLRADAIGSIDDVRAAGRALVGPSPEVRALKAELEDFLHRRVYRHYSVMRMALKGNRFLHHLFEEFRKNPLQLPERYAHRAQETSPHRAVCDYLAGMTDRFAQDEYLRLFQPYALV